MAAIISLTITSLPPLRFGFFLAAPVAACLVAAAANARGDDGHGQPVVLADRTRTPITIDGRLDEEAWALAPVQSGFRQRDPDEGQPATERTELRLLYDDDALYVGVRLHDRDPGHIVRQLSL